MSTTQSGVEMEAALQVQHQRQAENEASNSGVADQDDGAAHSGMAALNQPEAEASAQGGPQESDRDRIIREIAERRRESTDAAESDFVAYAGDQTDGGAAASATQGQPEDARMVKIKVDGEERQVPLSEVIEHGTRALQKDSAADKRLKEATEMRNAAELRAREVEQFARQLQEQQEQSRGQELSGKDAADMRQKAQQFMDVFMSGDEAAAVESLAEIMGRGNSATPDPREMIAKAQEAARGEIVRAETLRAQEEAKVLHANAKAEFSTQFSDIASDPMLFMLADNETTKVVSDHPEWDVTKDIGKILTEAGKRIREWHGGGNATTDKRDIKRTLQKPISGTSGRMPGKTEPKPMTTSEIIAAQRRARGLPVY